jgi:hypothetical protein
MFNYGKESPMNIAIACNTTWNQGGQGVCLAQLAQGVSQFSPLEVFCAASGRAIDYTMPKTELQPSRLSQAISSMPVLRRRSDLVVLWSDRRFDQQLCHQIRRSSFDLVIGVAGQSSESFKGAKQQGTKVWLYCLNHYLPWMQQEVQQEVALLNDSTVATMHPQTLERFQQECQQADLILVLSEVARQSFMQTGFAPEKLAVVTPYVDLHRFHPVAKSDPTFRVLYVGTIEPRKGVHYLIPAFLQADLANAELLLIGGPSTRALQQVLNHTLTHHPSIQQMFWDFSQQEPTSIYGRSSVLVLPSVEDGFGLVALEAMACGLPVIVTSHCGAADLVQDGVNGFVVPPRDPAAIAQKLTFLAKNEAVRMEMGKAARTTAEQYTQTHYNHTLYQIFVNQGMAV